MKKYVRHLILLCFAFLLVIGSTFAWFTQNKQVNNNGFDITIVNPDLDVQYEFYRYNKNTDRVDIVNFASLNPYDTIIEENNANTSLIIRCETNHIANLHLDLECSIDDATSYCMSNISNFSFIVDNNLSTSNLDALYQNLKSRVADKYRFVNDSIKATSIDLSLNNVRQLFIIVDYDVDLINTLNNGEQYISDDLSTEISFLSDLSAIVFHEVK